MSPYNRTPITGRSRRDGIVGGAVKRYKDIPDIAMDPDHYRRLLKCIKEHPASPRNAARDYVAFLLAGNCGLRPGEVVLMKCSAFDRLSGSLPMVKAPCLKKRRDEVPPKNIYIHPKVAAVLIARLPELIESEDQRYLFPGNSTEFADKHPAESGHMGTRWLSKIFGTYARTCRFEEAYSPHSLRHMYGSLVFERTQDLAFLRDQMGHASIAGAGVTNQYIHLSKNRVSDLVAKVGYII